MPGLQVQQAHGLGLDPVIDYLFPIWPTINCFNPERSDNSLVDPSDAFNNYLTAVGQTSEQFTQSGLFFTAQCAPSLPALSLVHLPGQLNTPRMLACWLRHASTMHPCLLASLLYTAAGGPERPP